MAVAGDNLIQEALIALNCVDLGAIGAVGGQKAVRLVEHAGRSCVLKVIAVDFATPDALKRAEREVELLAEIASVNVVKVESGLVELGTPVRGAAWIEEYLDGEDLGALLGARAWAWPEVRDLGIQVARGVAAGHEKKVIHRDLSANNVRRLSNGTYKVLDFGFARHTLRSGVTMAGQPGTPGFLTPEHLNSYSGGPMPASDVFQIGALMYCALTRSLPFPYNGDELDYFNRLAKVEYPALEMLRSDLPAEGVLLIRRTLHAQPARRYLNAEALATALEQI